MPRPHKRMNHTYTSETFRSVPCIIGIDQSYKRTGISIAFDNFSLNNLLFSGLYLTF